MLKKLLLALIISGCHLVALAQSTCFPDTCQSPLLSSTMAETGNGKLLDEADGFAAQLIVLIQAGDTEALRKLLDENPHLATARIRKTQPWGVKEVYSVLHIVTEKPGKKPNSPQSGRPTTTTSPPLTHSSILARTLTLTEAAAIPARKKTRLRRLCIRPLSGADWPLLVVSWSAVLTRL
jgi:hypothetical protein